MTPTEQQRAKRQVVCLREALFNVIVSGSLAGARQAAQAGLREERRILKGEGR